MKTHIIAPFKEIWIFFLLFKNKDNQVVVLEINLAGYLLHTAKEEKRRVKGRLRCIQEEE